MQVAEELTTFWDFQLESILVIFLSSCTYAEILAQQQSWEGKRVEKHMFQVLPLTFSLLSHC
jgi:hypothetical protein